MSNILKAIEKEKEYLSYRTNGEEPFHLVDAVKECGFNSLDDYFTAKRRLEIRKMDVIKVKSKEATATIQDFIVNQKHGFAYCVHDEKSIFINNPDNINEDACTEYGYIVLDTQHTGGAVVVNKGDISVVYFGVVGNVVMKDFAMYLIDRYKERGLNATYEDNDILIDGYKISGLSATPYGHIQYSTIHIGINTNVDHIKAICKKPMKKVPKGLSEYGITTEEVEKMFLDFCGWDE